MTDTAHTTINTSDEPHGIILQYKHVYHSGFMPSTRVLMADGTVKEIKDIMVGEMVMGDNGIRKRVLRRFNGYARMFLISQNKGDAYAVTANQCLVLRATGVTPYISTAVTSAGYGVAYFATCSGNVCRKRDCSKMGFRIKHPGFVTEQEAKDVERLLLAGEFDPTWVRNGDIFVMTLDQNMKMCNHEVRMDNMLGYKSPLPIFNISEALPLDPYYVGLWLGDGARRDARVSSSDPEIEEYHKLLASRYDNVILHRYISDKPGDTKIGGYTATKYCYVFYLRNSIQNVENPILRALKNLNLYMNKHIPDIYMNASTEDRYRLLAGLLDTDGCLDVANCQYVFGQEEHNKILVYQLRKLADTLGITSHEIYTQRHSPKGRERFKDGKTEHTDYITRLTGKNIFNIPCLIERKIASVKCAGHTFYSNNTSRLNIHPLNGSREDGTCEYVGIAVDGNNRFILADRTVVAGST